MDISRANRGSQDALHNRRQAVAGFRSRFRLGRQPTGRFRATLSRYRRLAGAQVFCFLLLSHLEPDFFLIHFYQTTIYLALLILLFYMEDRWAYMIGLLAPAAWLVMAFATGMLTA